jgi:predicted amidohydrolase
VQDGKLLPAALAAKQRGVIFDVGHGGGSSDFTVAEVAIPGGCAPDTISSDIHVFSGNSPGMPYLPWVMSKFLTCSVAKPLTTSVSPSGQRTSTTQPNPGLPFRAAKAGRYSDISRICA